jgi:hypothetical protein
MDNSMKNTAKTKPGRGILMIEPGVPSMKKGGACKLLPNIPKGKK